MSGQDRRFTSWTSSASSSAQRAGWWVTTTISPTFCWKTPSRRWSACWETKPPRSADPARKRVEPAGRSQTSLGEEAPVDLLDMRLARLQGLRRGVDGVVAQNQAMGVWNCRADHELCIAPCRETHPARGAVEDDDLALLQDLRGRNRALSQSQPEDSMVAGRVIAPGLAGLQRHCEIADRGGGFYGARREAIVAEKDAGRPHHRNAGGVQIKALRGAKLEVGREREPELEAACRARLARAAAMPDPAARAHPLHAAPAQEARSPIGVLVTNASLGDIGQGRQARVGMEAEARKPICVVVEEIEKHEGLQNLAEICGAHQAGDGPVAATAAAENHSAISGGAGSWRREGFGHIRSRSEVGQWGWGLRLGSQRRLGRRRRLTPYRRATGPAAVKGEAAGAEGGDLQQTAGDRDILHEMDHLVLVGEVPVEGQDRKST